MNSFSYTIQNSIPPEMLMNSQSNNSGPQPAPKKYTQIEMSPQLIYSSKASIFDFKREGSTPLTNSKNFTDEFQPKNLKTSSLSKSKHHPQVYYSDRFIPSRKASKLPLAMTELTEGIENINGEIMNTNAHNNNSEQESGIPSLYRSLILEHNPSTKRMLTFQNQNILRFNQLQSKEGLREVTEDRHNLFRDSLQRLPPKSSRKIPRIPYKVLDAPSLQDDFYLNLIDWSADNVLAVGLSTSVYLWAAATSKVTKLCELDPNDVITSVAWSPKSQNLSLGTNSGEIQVWDAIKLKRIRTMGGHSSRVGTQCWNSNVLTTGSRDKIIFHRDIRLPVNYFSRLTGHKQEICGLKWSFDAQQLCSGGNDNRLFIWNLHHTTPVAKLEGHTAAVKALAWSPHQHGLLASGGGTADRTLRFWNTLTNTQLACLDTGSQLCSLMFSKNTNEIVSTHGYSQNEIVIWKYPTLERVATLSGHFHRVLYLAMSPDGESIVTGAGDETLRFWRVFPSAREQGESSSGKCELFPSTFDLR